MSNATGNSIPSADHRRAPRRRLRAIGVGTLLVAGSVLGLAAPAFAHNYLVSSTPSADETLTTLPDKFVITTNEGLLDLTGHGAGFALQIRDASGLYYGDGCVTVSGPSMSTPAVIGAPGKYTVIWQLVSADGHTVSNTYSFTWAPTDTALVAAKGTAKPANCGGQSGGSAASTTQVADGASTTGNADLGDVLWIGGGIVAVGLAVTITLLVVGRKKKA